MAREEENHRLILTTNGKGRGNQKTMVTKQLDRRLRRKYVGGVNCYREVRPMTHSTQP